MLCFVIYLWMFKFISTQLFMLFTYTFNQDNIKGITPIPISYIFMDDEG